MKSDRAMEVVQLAVHLQKSLTSGNRDLFSESAVANDAWKIASIASRLHRYAEIDCNQGMTDLQKQQELKLQERIEEMVKPYGIEVAEYNGDPRGFAVYLKLPSGRMNDWGQRGWGI